MLRVGQISLKEDLLANQSRTQNMENCRDSTNKRSASIENTKSTNPSTVSSALHLSDIQNRWITDEAVKVIQKQNI
jgi:hypothetical protein